MKSRTALLALALVAACGSGSTPAKAAGTPLVGTFRLAAGTCTATSTTGTYFQMIQPGGTVAKGAYFKNPDSTCPDTSISVQTPGTDGGFVTTGYQPATGAPFDATGNATASRITRPGSFTAIKFGILTSAKDPQTGTAVAKPAISVKDGKLSGQITAWSAAWNNLYFNQGSPKPDGSRPGLTTPVTGTYDAATKAFVLTWASQIVGGPFNGFSGFWHLQGTFVPA